MTDLVKIDDEVITIEDFVKLLRFTGAFDGLLEDIIKDKLTVHAAKKAGIDYHRRGTPGARRSVAPGQGPAPRG